MDETATVWLAGRLEQAASQITRNGEPVTLFTLVVDGVDGPTTVNIEATGSEHAANFTARRPVKGDGVMVHGTILDPDGPGASDVAADTVALAVSHSGTRQ